jgi:quinol monooxygenase YgiN
MNAIFAKLRVRPDKVELYEKVSKELIETVRIREPDTVYYEQFKRPEEPNTYTVIEVYKDKASQASHADTAYFKSAFAEILTCVDGGINVEYYESLS